MRRVEDLDARGAGGEDERAAGHEDLPLVGLARAADVGPEIGGAEEETGGVRGARELGRREDAAGGLDHQEERRALEPGRDRRDRLSGCQLEPRMVHKLARRSIRRSGWTRSGFRGAGFTFDGPGCREDRSVRWSESFAL